MKKKIKAVRAFSLKALFLGTVIFASYSCNRKEEIILPEERAVNNTSVILGAPDTIPSEILKLMRQEFIEEGKPEKAEQLTQEYDLEKGIRRSKTSNQRYIYGVGNVRNGYFTELEGTTASVAVMGKMMPITLTNTFRNMMSPDAFDPTTPTQYLGNGTTLMGIILPVLKYYDSDKGKYANDPSYFNYSINKAGAGFQPYVNSTAWAVGSMYGIKIKVDPSGKAVTFPNDCLCLYGIKVYYRARTANGWNSWVKEDQDAGLGQTNLLKGLQIVAYAYY